MAEKESNGLLGYEEASLGYNYIKLSLNLLKGSAKMSAETSVEAGFQFSVTLSGDYSTKIGPAISAEVWALTIGSVEYSAAGSEKVKIDGNPITLKTALVEHDNVASTVNAIGAKVIAAAARTATRGNRTRARAMRNVTSGNRNQLGGRVSTGNTV
ncbi:hypothetical protein ACFOGJ_06135 [Marinibaculum pumilum]|uniref:Uncharacterized protein n=1 Tax=Marinibaculum pumilum TaxID=1766165 RepID=A0ABV7KWN2_9PROT